MNCESFEWRPIGYLRGGGKYAAHAPRQAAMADNQGYVELIDHPGLVEALDGLSGFAMIWLIFVFDRNEHWKSKVNPPENPTGKKIGVFATRSPHRPNPVGISAVVLDRIDGNKIYIRNFDLLDGTPILDIKPYLPAADAFAGIRAGWRDELPECGAALVFAGDTRQKLDFIREHGALDLGQFLHTQLATRTLNPKRQRLKLAAEPDGEHEIACRTWRIGFILSGGTATVVRISSGYTPEELATDLDPYQDKAVHRKFISSF